MSKAYATEAVLLEKGKFKVYQVTWVDTKGKQRVTDVRGHNMKSALDTVLRQRTADKVKSVPMFAWIIGYLLVNIVFAWSVTYGGVNVLAGVLGALALTVSGLLFVNKYFRYTE